MNALEFKRDNNEIKHLPLGFSVKEITEGGSFEGYASTTSVDLGGDIVEMGAFDRSLAQHKADGTSVKMLWQHDPTKVVGVWDEFRQDEKGLFVKGRLIKETALGGDIHALMRAGAIDSLSIGYRTVDADYDKGEGGVVIRRIKEAELWEVSVVTFPMNPEARVTTVKKADDLSKKDIERILREGGAPGEFAKLVAIYGYDEAKARLNGRREGDDKLRAALNDLKASTKRKAEISNA